MDINGNGEKKMLEIVKFIHEHEDWENLLSNAPYNLKISWDDGFVLFKYNQINSDFNEKICREARGLILDSTDNFKVVRFAFEKFFNLEESFAAHIDWDTAVASEKIDGSIMSVWFGRGKWHLSTNSTIDAFKAGLNSIGPYKNFGELFESVLPLSTFKNYNKHRCWTFELVSPYNKVVINYPETKVYLLSVRDMDSLDELCPDAVEMLADANGLAVPEHYNFNNKEDYSNLVKEMDDTHEGIVVRDDNGKRVKIKTLTYFDLHKKKNNGVMTLERVLDLIMKNDQAEFLSYFPEMTPYFDEVAKKYSDAIKNILEIDVEVTHWKTSRGLYPNRRKHFAEWVKDKPDKNLYFLAYDEKLLEKAKDSSAKDFIRLVRMEEEE